MLELHVQPGAKRTGVAGLHGDRLKVRLTARAVGGAANAALIELLSKLLDVAKRNVVIEAGRSSREKRVAILGGFRRTAAGTPDLGK